MYKENSLDFLLAEPLTGQRNIHKIEKYWLSHFVKQKKDFFLNQCGLLEFGRQEIENIFKSKDQDDNRIILDLIKKKMINEEEIIDLYLQKQENSFKKIRLKKIKKDKLAVLNDLESKINTIYNDKDYFKKYELYKEIENKINEPIRLIYINKIDENTFHLVFNYKVIWTELIRNRNYQIDNYNPEKFEETTHAVLVIDKATGLIQYRVTPHRGLSKKNINNTKNDIKDVYNALEEKLINILSIQKNDIEKLSISKNIQKLFQKDILRKYEGIHTSHESNAELTIRFTVAGFSKSKIDYTNLEAYGLLRGKLDKSIILIKGTWDTKHKDAKDIFIPDDRVIIFDVDNSEVTTLSSYTERELNYALLHVTKNS